MASPLHTPLCDKLGIAVPIIQAPIGGVCTPELVAAVGNEGGFGIHPISWVPVDGIAPLIGRTRALTNKPFGANLVLEWDQHARLDAALAAGVNVISFSWGDPAPYLAKTRAASAEADSHDFYRGRLVGAAETDTVHNTLFDDDWRDAPLRSLENSTWRGWLAAGKPERAERPGAGDVLARRGDGAAVSRYEGTSPSRDMSGDLEAMTLYAGQSVGLVRDVKPAGEIVREIADDAARILARLGKRSS